MTIEIKPAEIVGASIGDRVTWSHGRYPGAARYSGTLKGVTVDAEDSLLVIEDENGTIRHVHPAVVRLAPRKYAIGDQVDGKDFPYLPDGTLLLRKDYLPAFKVHDTWYVIDHGIPAPGIREVKLLDCERTIAWLPGIYTNN